MAPSSQRRAIERIAPLIASTNMSLFTKLSDASKRKRKGGGSDAAAASAAADARKQFLLAAVPVPGLTAKKAASQRRFVDSQARLAFHAQRDEFICKKYQCVIRIVDEDETSIGISMCTCIDI